MQTAVGQRATADTRRGQQVDQRRDQQHEVERLHRITSASASRRSLASTQVQHTVHCLAMTMLLFCAAPQSDADLNNRRRDERERGQETGIGDSLTVSSAAVSASFHTL